MNDRIAEILNGIKIFDGVYKKELIEDVAKRKKEITPFLIDILNKALSDPSK